MRSGEKWIKVWITWLFWGYLSGMSDYQAPTSRLEKVGANGWKLDIGE